MTDNSTNDLSWQATCYCLGELSESETVSFEALLSESQEAREAVAGAMALLGSIASAAEVKAPAVSLPKQADVPNTSRRSLWIAIGTTAAALLLAVTLLPMGSWNFLGNGLPQNSSERAELASIWLENAEVATSSGTDESLAVTEPESSLEMEELASDATPPTWMVAALLNESVDENSLDENSFEQDRAPVEN